MVYILNISKFDCYKDKLYLDSILWDIKTLTCQYSKTTGPILMKFTGYDKWTPRGLCTNFQSI